MTDNDKIYYPEVVETHALPETVAPTDNASGGTSDSKTNVSPSTQVDKTFPEKKVARETIGEALNTRTKKILGDFSFGQVGAISIGLYENGVSGDIRITPNGITARNINGVTTFSLDGTDGSAVFLGTVTAGSLISGNIIVGGADNEDGYISVLDASGVEKVKLDKDGIVVSSGKISVSNNGSTSILDAYGLVSSANFPFSIVTSSDTSDTTSSDSWSDITDMSVSITVSRAQQVMINVTFNGGQTNGGLTQTSPNGCRFRLLVGSDQVGYTATNYSIIYEDGGTTAYITTSSSLSVIANLLAGSTTVKLQFSSSINGRSARCIPSRCQLSYFKMGS